MNDDLTKSLSLVDLSGYIIIAAIVALLAAGVGLTFWLRLRYASLDRDLAEHAGTGSFAHSVLDHITRDASDAQRAHPGDINSQAIIDRNFQIGLRALLVAERFVKATTGLMIILGLVGTFYGLTLSIGKLVSLVSDDLTSAAEMTQSLTRGLTEALSGMSVAFSTSLFGIVAAILMTLLGVFFSVPDRRAATMVRIEDYVDNFLLKGLKAGSTQTTPLASVGPGGSDPHLAQIVASFGQSVTSLQAVVGQFDGALAKFSTTTRDFQEFNLHLKDNIQRMSLSFGDLSDALKQQAEQLRSRERS